MNINIKKVMRVFASFLIVFALLLAISTPSGDKVQTLLLTSNNVNSSKTVDIEQLLYTPSYNYENYGVCSKSSKKTYMSYKAITNKNSKQYKYISQNMYVDPVTGLLVHNDDPEIIAVALGSYYGPIGSMFEIELSTGKTIKVVKVDAKSDSHTVNGCYQEHDNSVIEFVIDTAISKQYRGGKLSGNFNTYNEFKGDIVKVSKITAK